jgi:AAA domain/Toprim-like
MTRPAILGKLRGVQPSGDGWMAFCPAHPDRKKQSLSVKRAEDGRTLLHCFVGCETAAICTAVNMTLADLAPLSSTNTNGPGPRREVAYYDYPDERGELLYQVVRFNPKDFRPRRPDGKGGWTWNLDGVRRVAYRLPDLAEQQRVVWVEGEKDVDRLWQAGIPATTSPIGASSFRAEYAQQLAAAAITEVVIIPDHDRPGHAYATAVAQAMQAAGLTVKWLALPGFGPVLDKHGPDVSDWLDADHTPEELVRLLAEATPWSEPPTPAAPSPTFAQHGTEYEYRAGDDERRPIVVTLSRVHEKDDTISAEVSVTRNGQELDFRRLNLLTDGRQKLIKTLGEVAGDVAWRDVIDPACRQTIGAIRRGRPAVLLRSRPGPVLTWFLHPLLPEGETTILFGPPDNLKSYVAGLTALLAANQGEIAGLRAARRVPVMVLDNETTEATWGGRLGRLASALNLDMDQIYYRELTRALPQEIDAIAAEVSRLGLGYVILDSQAPAAGEKPESADAAMRTLPPLRTLGPSVTRLVLAHMSKASGDDKEGASIYGSIFNAAQARATWEARRSTEDDGAAEVGQSHQPQTERRPPAATPGHLLPLRRRRGSDHRDQC